MKPYTELSNSITTDIDISSAEEIVNKLRLCDEEMFMPEGLSQSIKTLFSPEIVEAVCNVANEVKHLLENKNHNSAIVMSGCGTSGRIAFMMARTYNRMMKRKKFIYTIAGGDKALFTSQEAPEDDHIAGRNDLIKSCKGFSQVLFIGITCGLSAPYVAGQLDHCLSNTNVFTPVLLGFNPVELARNISIFKWNKTFLDVARQMEKESSNNKKAFIINPVLNGEAITGSSRMKGGSITKIILDVIFNLAISCSSSITTSLCESLLLKYMESCKDFYQQASPVLSSLVQSAGDSLKSGGHLYNVSSCGLGVLGIIDATECTPTYGSDLNDVRGFIKGGYKEYDNNEGDISDLGENYQISITDFTALLSLLNKKSSNIKKNIILIVISSPGDAIIEDIREENELGSYLANLSKIDDSQTRVAAICLLEEQMEKPCLPNYVSDVTILRLPSIYNSICDNPTLSSSGKQRLAESLLECWTKWLFNCISTGGHIIKGKVMKNYMVDLKVSNQKLFQRSIGIIQQFCPFLSETEAKRKLLCSIYEVDDVDATMMQSGVSSHILVSTPKNKVVPIAIVMSHKKCGFSEARDQLNRYHVIREALTKLTSQ